MEPYFYSFQEFIAMGKHGPYVWTTWGITVFIMIGFIIYSLSQRRRLIKDLRTQQARQLNRKQATKRN